ncbi:uracil-DNA glycosylase [Legionella massiliensis]|uniref:Uracil-DNA glycosylase n=1 Tax=Legionella massiliensis TaxID=1034943 RepID=A0A078L1K5_9GAMM|nr:uracil-DNA glycosylase [Legionella massiliensis]CDZ79091.1 uracil-DNA glycosylase [Legionella massiliensis]CEE14829.1 Uracil-DNA glycosylase [Legionella massiliensis]
MQDLIESTHPQWHKILTKALQLVDPQYLQQLRNSQDWLPGISNLLAAFSIPLNETKYILLGESPYPRQQSANGYAFWDQAVDNLWSISGLSKEVNRATSLRNWIKMLLTARGDLQSDCSQPAIAALDKTQYWQTGEQFFNSLINKGFLLLNASLVFSEDKVRFHARQWQPFMHSILLQLAEQNPSLQLILFGRIAEQVPEINLFSCLIAEHPYNLSFITNSQVLAFFKPLDLLNCHD